MSLNYGSTKSQTRIQQQGQLRPKYRQSPLIQPTTPAGEWEDQKEVTRQPPSYASNSAPPLSHQLRTTRFQPIHPSEMVFRSRQTTPTSTPGTNGKLTPADSSSPSSSPRVIRKRMVVNQLLEKADDSMGEEIEIGQQLHFRTIATNGFQQRRQPPSLDYQQRTTSIQPPRTISHGFRNELEGRSEGVTVDSQQRREVAEMDELLAPIDSNRLALESEIERLQALLAATPSRRAMAALALDRAPPTTTIDDEPVTLPPPQFQVKSKTSSRASSVHSSPRTAKPISHYMSRRSHSPTRLDSWMNDPVRTLGTAKERVKERELTLRAYIKATTHLWIILLLRAALVQLQTIRGSNFVKSLMQLPFVRSLLVFGTNASISTLNYLVNTRLFHALPGSTLVHSILNDADLQEQFNSMPELPLEEILPLTQGPLRPIFQLLSRLPLSSLFFTLEPLSNSPTPGPSSSPSLTPDHPILQQILSRLESQSVLIDLLRQDRYDLQTQIEAMNQRNELVLQELDRERARVKQQNEPRLGLRNRRSIGGGVNGQSFNDSMDSLDLPNEHEFISSSTATTIPSTSSSTSTPTSSASLRHQHHRFFRGTSEAEAEARLHELHTENVELRGLCCGQESSIQSQDAIIASMTEERLLLAERIQQLEEELKQQQQLKQGETASTANTPPITPITPMLNLSPTNEIDANLSATDL